ncbi:MAG: pyridoxal phosphate-dependent aminotransferase [Anaerolineae bacterium]
MPLPRRSVRELVSDQHGGPDYARLRDERIAPEEVLDFSVNGNPFSPPASVREALTRVAISRYPDPEAGLLRERLAALNGVSPAQVRVTSGTAEAIRLLALAYLESGDPALVVGPTFGEYRVSCEIVGAQVYTLHSQEEDRFQPDLDHLVAQIGALRPRLVWLCNPNNPTGVYLTAGQVRALLTACEGAGSLLVLDEAYVNFVASAWDSLRWLDSGHLVVLRSMTKDFALAGLRLGYVLGSEEVVRALGKVQPPWSVNGAAQAAGLAALDALDDYRDTWRRLHALAEEFRHALLHRGLAVLPSATHFFLVRTGDGDGTREALWRERILVRSCRSFGLPAYIRLATRLPEENKRLLSALEKIAVAEPLHLQREEHR